MALSADGCGDKGAGAQVGGRPRVGRGERGEGPGRRRQRRGGTLPFRSLERSLANFSLRLMNIYEENVLFEAAVRSRGPEGVRREGVWGCRRGWESPKLLDQPVNVCAPGTEASPKELPGLTRAGRSADLNNDH